MSFPSGRTNADPATSPDVLPGKSGPLEITGSVIIKERMPLCRKPVILFFMTGSSTIRSMTISALFCGNAETPSSLRKVIRTTYRRLWNVRWTAISGHLSEFRMDIGIISLKGSESMKIIAVSAVTAGGKTTAVNAVKEKLPRCTSLHFDDYSFEGEVEDFYQWMLDGADYNVWDLSPLKADIENIISMADIGVKDMEECVSGVDSANNSFNKIYIDVTKATDGIMEIASGINRISEFASNNAATTEEQASNINEIIELSDEIVTESNKLRAETENITHISENLNHYSDEINTDLSQYIV